LDGGNFADQADGIEPGAAAGIAAAEIVGEERAPASAEANAAAGSPFAAIVEVGGAAKIADRNAAGQSSAKVSMQAEDVVDVEGIGSDDTFVMRIAAAGVQPCDVFISGYVWILAVDALTFPVGDPVRSATLHGPFRPDTVPVTELVARLMTETVFD